MTTWQGGPQPAQPPKSGGNAKKIIWIVVIIAVVGAIIASCAITSGNPSPDDFIERTYTRDYSLDENDIDAFTSTKDIKTVRNEIVGQSKPVDERTASDGSIFLQYTDDIVALFVHNGTGTKIMADDYDRVHRHYYTYVGGWWSSTPPSSGWWRGGGSGDGGK